MTIQNIGGGTAYNIKFGSSSDFEMIQGKNLLDLGFMKNGLKYLARDQKIRFFFTNMIEDSEKKLATQLEITVTYQNSLREGKIFKRKIYEEKYVVDFSDFRGLLQAGKSPLRAIADGITGIYDPAKPESPLKVLAESMTNMDSNTTDLISKLEMLDAIVERLSEIRSDIAKMVPEIDPNI